MKTLWRFPDMCKLNFCSLQKFKPEPPSIHSLTNCPSNVKSFHFYANTIVSCDYGALTTNAHSSKVILFTEKPCSSSGKDSHNLVSDLVDELLPIGASDVGKIHEILDAKGGFLLKRNAGRLFIEFLNRMTPCPQVGIEAFNWKKKHSAANAPFLSEEFAKAINLAGRNRSLDIAYKLFTESIKKQVQTPAIYNALMSAYMYNGHADRACSLFEALKMDSCCRPTIVTFNILLSVFGRSLNVRDMEMVMEMMKDYNLTPNQTTYNNLIAGYVTAWLWDDMERVFELMLERSVVPNTATYLLMLRGYAMSGNLPKMEKTYELVKGHVNDNEHALIRCMICAYCKSAAAGRVEKIEALLRLIPDNEYRPWLNVLLIRLYAKENMVEKMEKSIDKAVEKSTPIITTSVMRAVISGYFQCNTVDKLAHFVKRAETEGWKLCRSLYHCKMVMYGSQNRMDEMENVLDEMGRSHFSLTKKTFLIMYKAYSKFGQKPKVYRLIGLMCKYGFGIPLDSSVH